jgi:uncharacterized membrane protein
VIFMTALGRAGITKILPIICLTGVVAALIGVTFLREQVRPIEWAGIGLIICGVVAVSRVAGGEVSLIPGNLALLSFTGLTGLLVVAALSLRRVGASIEFTLSVAAGLIFGLANIMAKLMTQRAAMGVGVEFTIWRGDMALALLLDYPLWVVIAANIGASVFFQTAFANGRASVVSPLVTILSNVLPIVAALTIFGEDIRFLHGVGIVLVLAGTALMALKGDGPRPAVETAS